MSCHTSWRATVLVTMSSDGHENLSCGSVEESL